MGTIVQRSSGGRELTWLFIRLVGGLSIIALSLGSVACAPGQSNASGQVPTPIAIPHGSLMPSTAVRCGTVQIAGYRGLPVNGTTALRAEQCFWQAYSQCHTASLTMTMMGVDANTVYLFTINKQGSRCLLDDTMQTSIIGSKHTTTINSTCAGLKQQQGGLLFLACGAAGDIFMPPPPKQ